MSETDFHGHVAIEIKLIEDSGLCFSARKHAYQTGEKTQVRPGSVWGDSERAL